MERRLGGTVAGVGAGPNVANPGMPVSLHAEKMTKLAAYWLRQQEKVARNVAPADVVMNMVRSVCGVRDTNEAYVAPTDFPVINDKYWPKTIETLTDFLDKFLGEINIPLGYVVRKTVELLVGDDPREAYPTIAAEMIHRATHDLTVYRSDNKKVWDIIAKMTRDEECWTYVKPAQRAHNGWAAFFVLYDHYLGANNVNNMASGDEYNLSNVHYQGEKKCWTFDNYASLQVDQHSILNGLKDHGHCGIDRGSEVRYLLSGIKTQSLDPFKTQILATPELRTDFHRYVNLFKDFIKQSAALQTPLDANVSRVETRDEYASGHGGEALEDRYYEPKEYDMFLHDQNNGLRELRLKHAAAAGGGNGRQNNGGDNSNARKRQKGPTNKELNRAIKALVSQMVKNDDDQASSGDDNADQSNRTNLSLTRQQATSNKKGKGN